MFQALLGLPTIIFLAWLISNNKRHFPWRLVASVLAAQLLLAILFLKVPFLQEVLLVINRMVLAFRALPLVLVFAALSALLWHWRILPWMITGLARLLTQSMQLSGAVGMGGMSALCPQRSGDIVQLAPLSVVSGMLATCMTGCVVGLIA